MDKKSLEEKLTSIQQQFDAITKQKADQEAEAFRLQGEYRLTQELINNLKPVKETKK